MTGDGPGEAAAVAAVLGTGADGLIERIRVDFGLDVTNAERVGGGADSAATVWRVSLADGTDLAAKLSARPRMRAGLALTARLAADGVPGIPAPLPALTGRPWTVEDGTILSLTPWIEGRPGAEGGLDAEQWRTFGTLLAGLHSAAPPAGITDLPREDYTTAWIDRGRELDRRLRTARSTDPVTGEAIRIWLDAADRLRIVGERAERLAERLVAADPPAVLCHADSHLLNVLVDADRRITLIDWDDIVLAPRERDLMFVLGGVLADRPVTAREQEWFFSAYGEVTVDPDRLHFYYCTRAVEDAVGLIEVAVDEGARDPAERARWVKLLDGLFSPTGLVTLAGG